MAQLVGSGRRKRGDVDVAGVERLDQPLDRPALAGRVPALEDDAHGRTELAVVQLTAVDQPQVEQPPLGPAETFALLVLGEAQREVAVLEAGVVLERRLVLPAGRAVVMVAVAVTTLIVFAHVACCSRSARVRRAHPAGREIQRARRASPRRLHGIDHVAHEVGFAGDDQQLLVGQMAHPADLAPGRVEDADTGPDVAGRVEGEGGHRRDLAGRPAHIASSSSTASQDSSL